MGVGVFFPFFVGSAGNGSVACDGRDGEENTDRSKGQFGSPKDLKSPKDLA